jgi:ankyrin repeat protein
MTALHLAARDGKVDAVRLIVFGDSISDEVVSSGHGVLNNTDGIRKQEEMKLRDNSGNSALHLAAEGGYTDICHFLLDSGADVQDQDEQLATPLHLASGKGHLNTVTALLSDMTNISVLDKFDSTALHRAASSGHLPVVQVLIKQGIDIQRANKRGWTALHLAAGNGHKEVVEMLINGLDDYLPKDRSGLTPLAFAILNDHANIAEVFFEKLSAHGQIFEEKEKAIQLAETRGNYALVEQLRQFKHHHFCGSL